MQEAFKWYDVDSDQFPRIQELLKDGFSIRAGSIAGSDEAFEEMCSLAEAIWEAVDEYDNPDDMNFELIDGDLYY